MTRNQRIRALTDFERRSALYYLAGYAPETLDAALDEMDRQAAEMDRQRAEKRAADLADRWDAWGVAADGRPTNNVDYTITTEEMDAHETRTMATCSACGTQTTWWHLPQMAIDQITEHVTREWMSH